LFYRLYVFPVKIPSLEERREDIPVLANYFLSKFATEQKKHLKSIHGELSGFLSLYPWRGNIRELEHFVERMVVLAPEHAEILDHDILPDEYRKAWASQRPEKPTVNISLFKRLEHFEKELIKNALAENHWNQARAARALNISEATIRYKMHKFGITRPSE
jgi:transcriptional regulator with PAS, ATPase and Fis domain